MQATRDPSSPQERVNMDLLHKIFVGRFADFLIVRSKLYGGHPPHGSGGGNAAVPLMIGAADTLLRSPIISIRVPVHPSLWIGLLSVPFERHSGIAPQDCFRWLWTGTRQKSAKLLARAFCITQKRIFCRGLHNPVQRPPSMQLNYIHWGFYSFKQLILGLSMKMVAVNSSWMSRKRQTKFDICKRPLYIRTWTTGRRCNADVFNVPSHIIEYLH